MGILKKIAELEKNVQAQQKAIEEITKLLNQFSQDVQNPRLNEDKMQHYFENIQTETNPIPLVLGESLVSKVQIVRERH